MYQPLLPFSHWRDAVEFAPKGVVYTRSWVAELLLDLTGYLGRENIVDALAIEPAAGEGAFLVPMAERLVASCVRQHRPFSDCATSLIAYELSEASARTSHEAVVKALTSAQVPEVDAETLARSWIRVGDYLLDAPGLPRAEFVIGNPPYIRLEEIPHDTVRLYRNAYHTMRGRADLYVAFFEAGLRQLKERGVCAYICADRWMLNQYGGELRRLVTEGFGVETIVEMHDVDAFHDEVSAYPAITVIRRARQGRVVVSKAGPAAGTAGGRVLASTLREAARGSPAKSPTGLTMEVVDGWFRGTDPWPCGSPARLAILRLLEERFELLESEATGTKVGIGVATGLDKIFITKDSKLVETSRLLPLAMAGDTVTGEFRWSGHYLVNPWNADGLVRLNGFPRLQAYLEKHQELIRKRNTAQKNPHGWYRTIDRVNLTLTGTRKLFIPDIKDCFNPVLDTGKTYPHHNLYFLVSASWDLEVLGGLLLSTIGQLFIEAYGVRMRGGYLRFQAQYLRRVRVPNPESIRRDQASELVQAFRARDRQRATRVAYEVYQVAPGELESAYRH
ncbi:MAG: Eco57I restriction-modification methylase domain-containing protein [Isosphaeraceae bacterium]